MQPDNELLQLNAYVDGEMDLQEQLAFEERLRTDPALSARVAEIRQLTTGIREEAQYHRAPDRLKELVGRAVARPPARSASPAAPQERGLASTLSAWLGWRPLVSALALATVATLALNLSLVQIGADQRLNEELVASHVRARMSERMVDVGSSDKHTVKPWLSARLDFSPPVRELTVPGSVFIGGRLDYLGGRRVAVLVYRQGNHLVDHYIWPSTAADRTPTVTMVKGFRIAEWTQGGMAHRLVSDVNEVELEAIVKDCRKTAALS